jgi:RNA polymerase sigma-70 factor (ECF subfamily)
MAEVDRQRQLDEPLVNAELVARGATDEVLVAAAKSGDHLAFVELWTRHSNTAFKIAYRIIGNRDDAEDAIVLPLLIHVDSGGRVLHCSEGLVGETK